MFVSTTTCRASESPILNPVSSILYIFPSKMSYFCTNLFQILKPLLQVLCCHLSSHCLNFHCLLRCQVLLMLHESLHPFYPGLEIGQIGVGNDPDPDPNRRVVGKGRSEQGPRSVNAMPRYRTGTDLSGLIPNRSVGRDR